MNLVRCARPAVCRSVGQRRRLSNVAAAIDPLVGLSPEHQEFFKVAHQFAQEKMLPFAAEWDEKEIFPIETMREAAKLGFGGIFVDEAYGGTGLGRLESALIWDALASACPSTTAYISIHNMCAGMIQRHGTDAQRREWLPALCSMESLASYCLTEPGAGSDAAALALKAETRGGDFVLNGAKAFISGASASGVYVVMARTDGPGAKGISCLLVPADAPGLSFGAKERKLGWNSQPTHILQFDDCRVPTSALLGKRGGGFSIAMAGLDGGRVSIGATSLGAAQASLQYALEHLGVRHAFGQPLANFQGLQFQAADAATRLAAARLMVRNAAQLLDAGDAAATVHCAMAKRFACDECYDVIDASLQMLGGYGYLKDYPIQRYLRDARVHRILEGTDNIMRVVVARDLLGARK